MNPQKKSILWACAAAYILALNFVWLDARQARKIKDRRWTDIAAFSKMITEVPVAAPAAGASEPLLIRLQKFVEQIGLKDRAPKLSAGPAAPGLPPTVTLSVEGVPFERIALLLERLSSESDVGVPSFRLERSGASEERFDFSASFTELPAGSY